MTETRTDVDDADRLARVTLSRTIEPGDLRVTGLVSELGASKMLGYLEAAADVESQRGFALAQEPATPRVEQVFGGGSGRRRPGTEHGTSRLVSGRCRSFWP